MKYSNRLKTIIAYSILALIVLFNAYIYRGEFKVLVDPNDNVFQYALVDEAKNILKNVFVGKLSPMYLLDSVNERWAEGFPLSYYYAHLPQAIIALTAFILPITTFKFFVILRALIFIAMPVMFFLGAEILGLGLFQSLLAAFFSQAIFTNGLYGIDSSSFIWRGWGLSSQLLAVFFLPLAFAYSLDYLRNKRNLGKAILFNFLVGQAHSGVFLMLLLSYPVYWLIEGVSENLFDWNKWKEATIRQIILGGSTIFSLAYFIIPFFLSGQYRNYSYWDPIWKFDSWGAKQILIWLFQGELFDFNRFPFITFAVIFGTFFGLRELFGDKKKRLELYFGILFVFYFILFLGRTTLGKLIDLVPGFSEFHLHRIIVMVQFFGIFIAAAFVNYLIRKLTGPVSNSSPPSARSISKNRHPSILSRKIFISLLTILLVIFGLITVYYLEKPVVKYAKENNEFIDRANGSYKKDLVYYSKIKDALLKLPKGRVYAGKPGNWGRNFMIGETPLYMVLAQDGFPTLGFLPESWSPNSDPESFFADDNLDFYKLYNVNYAVYPDSVKPPAFFQKILTSGKYNLYKIQTDGWFGIGKSDLGISTKKTYLLNITRTWYASQFFKTPDYPKIGLGSLDQGEFKMKIRMEDLNHYRIEDNKLFDNHVRNIWQENPFYSKNPVLAQDLNWNKTSEEVLPNGYKVQFNLKNDCQNCIIVFRESFHPGWQVVVNDKKTDTFPVLPFYIGIPVEKSGVYTVLATYQPSTLKTVLLVLEFGGFGGLVWLWLRRRSDR
jgi:hypothetical protein